MLTIEEAKCGLTKLRDAGMRKLNFAGGEPLLKPEFVGELARFCKVELGIESVSIVTNASKLVSFCLLCILIIFNRKTYCRIVDS
jgi:radical S-adenosyl methionine domain-containing protein 2